MQAYCLRFYFFLVTVIIFVKMVGVAVAMQFLRPGVQVSGFARLSVMLFSIPPTNHRGKVQTCSSVSKLLRAGLDLRIHSCTLVC